MKTITGGLLLSAVIPLALRACGGGDNKADGMAGIEGMDRGEAAKPADKVAVTLSVQQIVDSGIVRQQSCGGRD